MMETYSVAMPLRSLRTSKKISQSELARAIGVDRSTVTLWEQGHRGPQMPYLIKLCKYFNTDLNYLLGFDITRPAPKQGRSINLYVNGKTSNQELVLPSNILGKDDGYKAEMNSDGKTITVYNKETPCMIITSLG